MPRRQHLPDDLTPGQVVALQDALLSNADQLLQAAVAMLEGDSAPLARSLAILGMEESGKAIALHERRVRMAYAPEGEPFVDVQIGRASCRERVQIAVGAGTCKKTEGMERSRHCMK